ncbi:MAG: hypothetical protein H7Y22_01120 [Gemmatimonadaceae bacterium]|nr:hypothetical protein [Gloeobacterales cyanobacterium ES-bin-141]
MLGAVFGALPVAAQYPQLPPPSALPPPPPIRSLPTLPPPPPQVLPPYSPGGAGGQYPQLPVLPPPGGSTVPAMPASPALNNPFSNMERTIFTSIKDATNLIFNSSWYWSFAWVTVVAATLFALYRILWRSAAALAGGSTEGIVQFVLFDAVWVVLIQQLTLHPGILLEPCFSAFEFANALGDKLLFDQTNGAATITDLLNGTANAVGQGYQLNGFGSYQVAWSVTLLMMLLLGALYYFQFVCGVIYLYFVMPLLMRPALAGLLTKPTEAWFPTVLNTGLTQILKPLIGKTFLWFTFCVLNLAISQVALVKVPGIGNVPLIGNLANAPARSVGMLAVYIMVLIFGILLQFSVPTVAKVISLTINGTSGDLAEDLGAKGVGLLLAGTTLAMRAGGRLAPLLNKEMNVPLPKLGGKGIRQVNGEVVPNPTQLGVDRQFKGGSPRQLQLTDGKGPRPGSGPRGGSAPGGFRNYTPRGKDSDKPIDVEFETLPGPKPATPAGPAPGDGAIVTPAPSDSVPSDREVINPFPGDEK